MTSTPSTGATASVVISTPSLTVTEGSAGTYRTGRYTVALSTPPSSATTVTPSIGTNPANAMIQVAPSTLTFNTSNYNVPQTVTVTPVKDTDTSGTTSPITVSHTLSPSYGGNDDLSVSVTVIDTTPTLQLSTDPEDVTEGGAIRLAVRASRAFSGSLPVRLSLSARDSSGFDAADIPGGLGPRVFTVEFGASGSTTGTVTIPTSRDANTAEGDEAYEIRLEDATDNCCYAVGSDRTADGTLKDGPAPPRTGGGGGGSSSRTPDEDAEQGQTPQPAKPTRPTVATTPVFQLLRDPADVREGEGINLMVTSSSPLAGNHVVRLSLSDRDNSGFTAADIPGSLGPRLFNAAFGESASRSGVITIPTSRDVAVEGRETYRIRLNSGSGYSLGNDVRADGTLLDPLPVFQLPEDPADVTEGDAIKLMVRSNSPLRGSHVVRLTLSDRDNSGFTAADIPGELGPRLFNAAFGESASRSGVITIPTSTDAVVEIRETYRIRLNAGSGYSLGSDVRADGMLLDPRPAKPTGLTATPGNEQVTLSWEDPQDASITVWQVQYKQDDGSYGNWEDIPNSDDTTTSYTVRGLRNGSRYEFRLRAVNGVGAGEASDPVTATPFDPDAARAAKARKAALTGLSRATLSSATDVIGGRISGALITPTTSDGSIGEQALGIVEDILGISDTALPTTLSMEGIGEQLWHQTFQLTPPPPTATARATADGEGAPAAESEQRNWALWGAGNLQRFSGDDAQESMSYEGNLKTAWLGIDQQFRAPWHGGVAASFALGKTDYNYERTSGEDAGGTIKSRVTSFYPYGSVQLNERLRLWGTAGLGFGELRHQESSNDDTDTQQEEHQGDLRMQLALVGFEQQLSSIGTWDFSLAGDLGLIKTTSQWHDHSGLEDLSITITRARLGVDSSFPLSESTRGYLNLRGRMDGGELQMGAAEAVAGLHYSAARLSALLQGRQTYALDGDYSESGIMAQLLFSSQEDGTGLALELQPSYGHYGDAQQPFFFDDDQLQALTGQSTSQQDEGLGLKSMLGYGFRPQDNDLLLTPFAELSFSQGRRYLLGVGLNLEAPPWQVKLTGSREETGNSSPTGKLQLLFSTQL